VTEGDFLRRGRHRPRWLEFILGPGRLAQEYVHTSGRKVEEIMTSDPWTIAEDQTLDAVVEMMERRHIKRIPVTRGGHMVGMISCHELLVAYCVWIDDNHQLQRAPFPADVLEPAKSE